MKQYPSVRTAVRFALAAGLAASLGAPAAVSAAQNPNAANLGKVTVTGTRIKRTAIEKAQPVLNISRQQIQQTGLVSVGQLLQRISSAGSAANRGYSNGGTGATHADLRYLGAQRVLVLINGHRLTLGGNGGGSGIGLQLGLSQRADLNVIPTSIIDHIQVLKDGASAVYGTDAIAGVINIITRKNFNGAEASAYVGGYENHDFDGLRQQYQATLGHSWDRGNVTVNLSYQQLDAINSKDRKISRSIPGTGTTFFETNHKGEFRLNKNSPFGKKFYVLKNPHGTTHPTMNDLKTFDSSDLNRVNYHYPDLQTAQDRLGAYFQGYYDITDHIQFNSTFIYTDRKSPDNIGQDGVFYYPGFVPRPGQAPIKLAADNPYNPFGTDIVSSNGSNNMVTEIAASGPDSPDTVYTEDSRFLQYIGGFSGDFRVGGRTFNWDASFVYGNDDESTTAVTGYNTEHLRRALGSPSQCGPGTFHSNCVPYNLFGPNTQAANDYIFFKGLDHDANTERTYNANISSADIVDLPYGPLGIALGYQHREQDGKVIPDSLTSAGLSDENQVGPTSGRFDVNAVYGEINVPILANLPGAKDLSIDVQSRHSNYSTFGGNTSTRAGFRYQPIEDILVRGTWSQGFRAPGINDLFGGLADNFPQVQDPCNDIQYPGESAAVHQRCMADGVPAGGYHQNGAQIRTEQGGNPDLQPETSLSRTVGFVYSPSQLPGLSVNADYYKIEVDHALITLGSQNLFNACYLGGNQSFCSAITRNANGGNVNRVLDLKRNIASFTTNGIDYGVTYKFPSTPVGDFTAQVHGTHIILFNETTPNFKHPGGFSTQKFVNGNQGGLQFPGGVPANKINFDLTWNYGNWSANYYFQYIEGVTEDCVSGNTVTGVTYNEAGLCNIPAVTAGDAKNRLGDTVYHDVQVSYNYQPINTTFTVGVNNLLDRSPPVSFSAFENNYNPFLYRIPGRFLYGRITTRF
jgi:outer membrane receptor protein involved in Fe transport